MATLQRDVGALKAQVAAQPDPTAATSNSMMYIQAQQKQIGQLQEKNAEMHKELQALKHAQGLHNHDHYNCQQQEATVMALKSEVGSLKIMVVKFLEQLDQHQKIQQATFFHPSLPSAALPFAAQPSAV